MLVFSTVLYKLGHGRNLSIESYSITVETLISGKTNLTTVTSEMIF